MQKVPGIASVRVSLNEGLTVLDLNPSNTVTLAHLREVIRNNGFVTKEAQVTASGLITSPDGNVMFEVSGSRERLSLQRGTGQQATRYDDLKATAQTGRSSAILLSGTADINDPKAIKMLVNSIGQP